MNFKLCIIKTTFMEKNMSEEGSPEQTLNVDETSKKRGNHV
jgi:hypothetical protein